MMFFCFLLFMFHVSAPILCVWGGGYHEVCIKYLIDKIVLFRTIVSFSGDSILSSCVYIGLSFSSSLPCSFFFFLVAWHCHSFHVLIVTNYPPLYHEFITKLKKL